MTKPESIKPILFSTEMVRAIRKGDKTQTRRIVKYPKKIKEAKVGFSAWCEDGEFTVRGIHESGEIGDSFFKLPFKKGDIMWVRETFTQSNDEITYRADVCSKWDLPKGCKWKPSIFMPKNVCRLFLEITKVRIEKLQSISDKDSIAEGIKREVFPETGETCYYFYPCKDLRDNSYLDCPTTSFYSLWKSINGQESWEQNPYVFIYEFKQIERPLDFLNL